MTEQLHFLLRLRKLQPRTRLMPAGVRVRACFPGGFICFISSVWLHLFHFIYLYLSYFSYFICLTSSTTPCTTNRPVPPAFPWQVDSVTISGLPCVDAS